MICVKRNCILSGFIYGFAFFILHNNLCSQNESWTSDDFPGSQFMGVFEIEGKLYGAASTGPLLNYFPDISYQLSIYEITLLNNNLGLQLDEIRKIIFDDNYATIAINYIEEKRMWITAQSSFVANRKQIYRVSTYDFNFNVVESQMIDTLGQPAFFHFDTKNDITYLLGSLLAPPRDELFFLKYDHALPLPPIEITQSAPDPMFFVSSLEVDKRTGNLLVFYWNGIAFLDENLNQKQVYDPNQLGTGRHGDVIGLGDYYYSHGSTFNVGGGGTGTRWNVLHKYDTLFNIIVADTFGIPNQDNYPFIINSIAYRNDEILCGGHLSGPYNNLDFEVDNKKFYLAKLDRDLNLKWYKEFGGDKAYIINGLHLLENGGCFVYGFLTDSIDSHRYAYIMLIDENGEITSTHQIPNVYLPTIKVVNPGYGNLTVLNPENLEAEITLYAIDGKELFHSLLGPGTQEFSLPSILPGIYPYMLMRDGKFYGSGKWLKQ